MKIQKELELLARLDKAHLRGGDYKSLLWQIIGECFSNAIARDVIYKTVTRYLDNKEKP